MVEALVSGEPWTRELLAGKFVEVFRRDPREGYAARFYEFLLDVTDGADFLRRIRPDSDKSGAAMRAAITAVSRAASQSALLRDCIDFGGDVDTVAAIALAAAACSPEIEPDLPEVLVLQLESGTFGRDYLLALDRQLMALAGPLPT